MKHLHDYILVLLCAVLCACNNDDVDFSYTPSAPHAGQRIVFSNLTAEGEDWAWDFGDGSESESKNPTKIYKDPGTYTVTLNVDNKKWLTVSKTVTVLDTVPSLSQSTDSVCYYQSVELSADYYNPYSEDVSYKWLLPEHAVLQSGETDSETISIYFTEYNIDATVELHLTIGEQTDTLQSTFRVHDTPATSLLLSTKEGNLYRQRLYQYGPEAADRLAIQPECMTQVAALLPQGDELFILNADPTEAGAIYKMNLKSQEVVSVLRNSEANAAFGYYGGMLAGEHIYWLNAQHELYSIAQDATDQTLTTDKQYLFATVADLTGFAGGAGADLVQYAQTFFRTADKGLYLFRETDIASGAIPQTAPILTDYVITQIEIDAIARKIYFVAEDSLWVSNTDGTYPKRLAATMGAIAIDNTNNRIYFSDAEGVAYLPLVQSPNNNTAAEQVRFNNMNHVTVAVDNTKR